MKHRRERRPGAAYCERTGKRVWPSKRAAKQGMRSLRARLRVYQCEFCRGYHFTSAPHREE